MGESGKVRGFCATLLRKCTSSRIVLNRATMKWTDGRPKLEALLEIFAAEVIGTALLMYFGCMGCFASASHWQPLPPMQSALVFGFLVSSLVTAMGHISKTHLNPAVTLCAYLLGTISASTAAVYFVAETLGAILGTFLLKATTPAALFVLYANNSTKLCTTSLAPGLTIGQGFLIEFAATSFLVFMVCSVWDPRNAGTSDSVAIKFALLISALSICAGPFTGASMNPVRSLAPAILNEDAWSDHWLYWLAPLSGSAVTTTLYKHLFMRRLTPNANTRSTVDEPAARNLVGDSLKERKVLNVNVNEGNSSEEKIASDVA